MTDRQPDELTDTLERWLAIDSTTGRERSFLEKLEESFDGDPWQIERQHIEPGRWNLIITDGDPLEVLFCTHVDTVPPHLPVRRDGDTVYGRGACDTKGGLLAMTEAADRLHADGVGGLGFLLVVGEEVDHRGAIAARELDLSPKKILLCEPTKNRVVRAQKGMLKFTLKTTGVAGHSAYPDDGSSAIDPLLTAIERIRHHDWPSDDVLGPTTLNIGVVEGGVAANVFAPQARAELLFRAVDDVEPMLEDVKTLIGDDVLLDEPIYNDPVFFDPPEHVTTCTVPFNTDAPYLRDLGDIWLTGPGDIRVAHSEDEHIEIDEIFRGIQLYQTLTKRVVNRPN